MTYFFIDFENVHETGLKGVEALPAEDRVHLFYTVNANKVSWELFEICRSSNIILHKVAAGKQALDMMLSSFLGHTVANDPGAKFVVISRDRDYDPVVDFWNMAEPPVAVSRFTSIAAACGLASEAEEPETEEQPERRRAYASRSRRGRGPLRSGAQRFVQEEVPETAAAEGLPAAPEKEAGKAAVEPPMPEEAAGSPKTEEGTGAPVAEETKPAPEKKEPRARRTNRSRSAKAEKPAETAEASEKAEGSEKEEKPKAEKKAAEPKTEKKPSESARRTGPESNAVHNAVQKVLASEKIESSTIAFLASLTAKNWGKPNDKQLIYRAVIKQFGQKEGLRLYGIMKPCLKG